MLRLYCRLTGDDFELVKNDTPASKRKIALYVTCLIVPVIMWLINGVLLVNQVLSSSMTTAILTGVIIAFLVFLIERAIIMSERSNVIAWFRVFLGLIVAFLGSVSLDEVIFKSDIDRQVAENEAVTIQQALSKVDDQFNVKISSLQEEVHNAWDDVKKEMQGVSGSSGLRGKGVIANQLIERAKALEKEKLDAGERIQEEKNKARERLQNTYNDGFLLIRIKAMFDLVLKGGWMTVVYIFFTLFLLCLELLVVIIKMFSKETNYEKKIKAIEEIGEERIKRVVGKDHEYFKPGKLYQAAKRAEVAIRQSSPAIFS